MTKKEASELLDEIRRQAHDIGWANGKLQSISVTESRDAALVPMLEDEELLAALEAADAHRQVQRRLMFGLEHDLQRLNDTTRALLKQYKGDRRG